MSQTSAVVGYIKQDAVVGRVNELLQDRAPQFLTSLTTAINENDKLASCEPNSVLTAALTAASLDLPINQNLGFAYLIPYNNKKKVTGEDGKSQWVESQICQFQMGYKGFVQLAQRSGFYKTINATDVREGEIESNDRLSGEITFSWLDNKDRENAPIIGYVAYFKLLNGFEKMFYMTSEELEAHARKYSKNFAKWNSGFWKDDFNSMAKKTVLKLLISKFGPLNTNLQKALSEDQKIEGKYADNPNTVVIEDAELGSSEETSNANEYNNEKEEE